MCSEIEKILESTRKLSIDTTSNSAPAPPLNNKPRPIKSSFRQTEAVYKAAVGRKPMTKRGQIARRSIGQQPLKQATPPNLEDGKMKGKESTVSMVTEIGSSSIKSHLLIEEV